MSHNKRYLFTNADGKLTITTLGCEDDSPDAARLLNKTLFEFSRPYLTHPSLTGKALTTWQSTVKFEDYTGPIPITYRECDIIDLPDRYFRDAWTDDGVSIQIDMPKARDIHMDRIRIVRNRELKNLDIERAKAQDINDTVQLSRISIESQILRDIPQTFDLTIYKTPTELKTAWPSNLPTQVQQIR